MIKLKFDTVTVVSRHCRDICRYLRCFRQSGAGVIELKLGTVTPRQSGAGTIELKFDNNVSRHC